LIIVGLLLRHVYTPAPKVPPNSQLTIKATIDRPLPSGWRLIVFHNGDPKSQGNGVYYTVCEINGKAGNSQTSCGDTRPTLPSPGDDFVGAQVQSPQGSSSTSRSTSQSAKEADVDDVLRRHRL
jgi:hypothetical protein